MDRLRRLAYSSARGIASEYIMIADRNIRSDSSAEVRLQLQAEGKVWPLAEMVGATLFRLLRSNFRRVTPS